MKHGVAPDGSYLYPAFPFGSYQRMSYEDLIDLKAYLDSLPAVKNQVPPHELRLSVQYPPRAWALASGCTSNGESFVPDPHASAELNRGAYLVTGPGPLHRVPFLAQYHRRPRQGQANSPARRIRPARAACRTSPPSEDGIGDWSEDDIAYLLETGNTPDFDVIGESMAPVQENMAKLTAEDRKAIAAYIKSLPPRPDAVPKSEQQDEDEDDEEQGGAAKSGSDNGAKQPDDAQ